MAPTMQSLINDSPLSVKLVSAAVVMLVFWKGPQVAHAILTWVTEMWLLWTQSIPSVEAPGKKMPSAPYSWPDGQGNTAKYMYGKQNSEKWERQYGGVYRIWNGLRSEVVLTKAEHIKAVYKDSQHHLKAADGNSGHIMSRLLGSCMGLLSHDMWHSIRHVYDGPFTHSNVKEYTELVIEETEKFLQGVDASVAKTGQVDPIWDFKMLPFIIVAKVLYGDLSDALLGELLAICAPREHVWKYVIAGGLTRFAWAKYLPIDSVQKQLKELRAFELRWSAFNDAAHAEAIERVQAGKPRAPIQDFYDAVAEGKFSQVNLLQTMDEILFGNLDVSTGAISWVMVFAASDKEVQRKLLEEFEDQRISDASTTLRDVPPAYLSAANTYLNACVLETGRIKPLASFNIPQSAPTERVLDGYRVPAGTNYVIDAHALNLRNPFWGEDRDSFRPERFLERKNNANLRYNYWRFGFGPRQCLGKYLGDMIMGALLVAIVSRYDMSVPGNKDEWSRDMNTWLVHPNFKVNATLRKQENEKTLAAQ